MTDFDHAEISRRLALAIGWPEQKLYSEGDGSFCSINVTPPDVFGEMWRDFDYRDPLIAWRVAERFNCFPAMVSSGTQWYAYTAGASTTWADTAALAVAMAVIKAKEKS